MLFRVASPDSAMIFERSRAPWMFAADMLSWTWVRRACQVGSIRAVDVTAWKRFSWAGSSPGGARSPNIDSVLDWYVADCAPGFIEGMAVARTHTTAVIHSSAGAERDVGPRLVRLEPHLDASLRRHRLRLLDLGLERLVEIGDGLDPQHLRSGPQPGHGDPGQEVTRAHRRTDLGAGASHLGSHRVLVLHRLTHHRIVGPGPAPALKHLDRQLPVRAGRSERQP